MLNPTPREKMLDRQNRPYFLWDCDLDVEQFKNRLEHPDKTVRAYFVGKLMRQAKPDDVFEFVSARTIRELAVRDVGIPRPCLEVGSARCNGGCATGWLEGAIDERADFHEWLAGRLAALGTPET
jgi:hypothetical protein